MPGSEKNDTRASRSAVQYATGIFTESSNAIKREPSPRGQRNSTKKLQAGDEVRIYRRKRDIEACEERCNSGDVVHLAPTRLCKLPTPVCDRRISEHEASPGDNSYESHSERKVTGILDAYLITIPLEPVEPACISSAAARRQHELVSPSSHLSRSMDIPVKCSDGRCANCCGSRISLQAEDRPG